MPNFPLTNFGDGTTNPRQYGTPNSKSSLVEVTVYLDTHPAAFTEVAHLDAFNARIQQEKQDLKVNCCYLAYQRELEAWLAFCNSRKPQQLRFVKRVMQYAKTQRDPQRGGASRCFQCRMQQGRQDEQQLLFVETVLRKARTQRYVREQEGGAIPRIPESTTNP